MRRALPAVAAVLLAAGCLMSIDESKLEGIADGGARDARRGADVGDLDPIDVPLDSGPADDTGVSVPEDAAEASVVPDVDAAPQCVDGFRCGGHGVEGATNTLYQCLPDGGARSHITCKRGCFVSPTFKDRCNCVAGGFYCGLDQVIGDPGTLYKCLADSTTTVQRVCPNKCNVNPGADDTCS